MNKELLKSELISAKATAKATIEEMKVTTVELIERLNKRKELEQRWIKILESLA